jgi:hypothetical protein
MRLSARFKPLIGLSLIVAATLLAYGDALRLPLYFDDIMQTIWLRGQTLGSLFVTAAGRAYYRPMQFFLPKLYEVLFSNDSAMMYHAFSIVVHAINALLVVYLARRLTDRRRPWWPSVLAGLIFVLFPFSYQVVTLPASFNHSMAVLFVLSSVLAYDVFRSRGQRRWLVVALVCAWLAFSSNEGAILLAGLIGLWEYARPVKKKQWRWVLVFTLLAALFYLWYQSRPHENAGRELLQGVETISQNGIYILQGLTFPLQPLGRTLMTWGSSDQAAVVAIAAVTLLGLVWSYQRAGQTRRFVLSAGWYVGCLATPVILLSHDYFINAPRVLYLGSVGVALLWSGAAECVAGLRWPKVARWMTVGALIVIALAPPFVFIRQRLDLHHVNAEPLITVLATAQQRPVEARLLFVNLPAWVSTPQLWYPIGHEGALFMPSYSTLSSFVAANTNRASNAEAVEFNSLSTPEPYYYGVFGPALGWEQLVPLVQKADRVYLTRYALDHIELVEAGRVTNATKLSPQRVTATFGDAAVLEAVTWKICQDQLNVRLNWSATPGSDWHVFVHVLNPDGTLAAQHDSPPLLGLYPFGQWVKGDRVEDVHPIDVSQLLRDRQYTIAVGLYDPGNGERLAPRLSNGEQPEDRAVGIGQFTIGPALDNCR